jgi:hypothetical protein
LQRWFSQPVVNELGVGVVFDDQQTGTGEGFDALGSEGCSERILMDRVNHDRLRAARGEPVDDQPAKIDIQPYGARADGSKYVGNPGMGNPRQC